MNKKRWIILLLIVAIYSLALGGCSPSAPEETSEPEEEEVEEPFSVTVTDGAGNVVTLTKKPVRIISLTLGTDEILLDLAGPERLLGVTYLASDASTSNIADHPDLTKVENVVEADPEQIIALEPDLVFVASFTDPAVIEQLEDAGLTVFVVGFFDSIGGIQTNILSIGKLVGELDQAQAMVDDMDTRLGEIAQTVAEADEQPTVLYLASDGWTAGSGTTVDDIIRHAGGVNVAADLISWNQIGEETILEFNPDAVLLSTYVPDDEFVNNPVFAELSAIANERVFAISDAQMSAVSHYIVLGVESLAKLLYPDLFG